MCVYQKIPTRYRYDEGGGGGGGVHVFLIKG